MSSNPRELAEEVGGGNETLESQNLESPCLHFLDCNAESEGVGGTTERSKLPSDPQVLKANKNEVSKYCYY
jgi:hypothetical protein